MLLPKAFDRFAEVWAVDFEFNDTDGNRPNVVCVAARELRTQRVLRIFKDDLGAFPPYSCGPEALFVAYFATAELDCHLALGWPLPQNVLDLYVEFRALTNGRSNGRSLLDALIHFGLSHMHEETKTDMRELILSGGPFTDAERAAILDYCQSDVDALAGLLPQMASAIHLPQALHRGRYTKAVSKMQHVGVPIDATSFDRFTAYWSDIREDLIAEIDTDDIFEGETFKQEKFAKFLLGRNIAWPRLPSGALDLKTDTFRMMAKAYPEIAPLHELLHTLSKMRQIKLAVGRDGRNRCLLSPFGARTSRNTPQASRFIFGPSAWLRSLIKPEPGTGVAYLDWSQQEIAIAAALSDDRNMQEDYASGDFYLAFAKKAGAIPESGTKQTHKGIRDLYKTCALGVQYGLSERSLAQTAGVPVYQARALLDDHKRTYAQFWNWQDRVCDSAFLGLEIRTIFGWPLQIAEGAKPLSVRNFPMQANGAEMLRLATIALQEEEGITVIAPVHDAVMIEAPLSEFDDTIKKARSIMERASEVITSGKLTVRVDVDETRWPDRYVDERGAKMWSIVDRLTARFEQEAGVD